MLTVNDTVLWVTQYNQNAASHVMGRFSDGPRYKLSSRLEEALVSSAGVALVVTAPDTHFAVADACLRSGISCLVEKPLAFRADEALSLIEVAANKKLVLAAGLHLLSASYLLHFKSQVSGRELSKIDVRWFDPAHEIRHGVQKATDDRTPIAHDIYPHIWSIVRVLTGCDRQVVVNVWKEQRDSLSFESSAQEVPVVGHCGRRAKARERKVEVFFRDGGAASLDFTEEPGHGSLDGMPLLPDPRWGTTPRPVMAEVQDFLNLTSSQFCDPAWPHLARNCFDSVVGAEALDSAILH
jgi:predicted dehydrogenase